MRTRLSLRQARGIDKSWRGDARDLGQGQDHDLGQGHTGQEGNSHSACCDNYTAFLIVGTPYIFGFNFFFILVLIFRILGMLQPKYV